MKMVNQTLLRCQRRILIRQTENLSPQELPRSHLIYQELPRSHLIGENREVKITRTRASETNQKHKRSSFKSSLSCGNQRCYTRLLQVKAAVPPVLLSPSFTVPRGFTLTKAWNLLKKVHRRSQPSPRLSWRLIRGCMVRYLWQHKRPEMKVCPICSKNVGTSTSCSSCNKRLSAGSVDSAMSVEIQKSIESLQISRGGSLSPSQKLTKVFTEDEA